ncbi:hypothetical protein N7508_010819 [Penicillium antarcticum]|uniref:uncharacterized protein n=1 Tax=Penicillium antarcticum TaxID=416450 RepID=UPI00239AC74E|nr:uncharacterized protein N7508_010819 [Penicillium antarcticum]KAJ5295998.1 hypothetical protein N7508_010819 [Penicillium antarcticum]
MTLVHGIELHSDVWEAITKVLDLEDWNPNFAECFDPLVPGVYTFGSVPLTEGRLLSWPNTLRSKQEPFNLLEPSEPGNLTVIKLRLVDPLYHICSTRNVPPQQQHEWTPGA